MRLRPTDFELRDPTPRPRGDGAPAAAPHGERISLTSGARDLSRGQGPHARGDVLWYRVARHACHAARPASAGRRCEVALPAAGAASALPGGRHPRSAIQAYRAGMELPAA